MPNLFSVFKTRASLPVALPDLPATQSTVSSAYQPFYLYNGNLLTTNTASNPVLTQQGLVGLPAAWASVNLISNACATMLASGDVYDPMGSEVLPTPAVCRYPNPMYGSYEFWHEVIATLLIYGNYVGVLYEGNVVPVHPSNVECRISNAGFPVYKIGDNLYSHEDILHVRGFTMPGTWYGIGAIEAHRKQLAASVNMQSYSSSTFQTGSVPTSVIKLDAKNVPQETLTQVGEDWQNAFGYGQRKPVVLPQGLDVQPLAWSPIDSQFIEAAKLDIAQTALIFGLDPSVLGASIGGASLTYANLTQANMALIQRSFAPWTIRVEQAWKKVLPEGFTFQANPEALLRMDTSSRYAAYTTALGAGFMTVAEVRALEDLAPLQETNAIGELPQ